jgi:type 2 lantibiotic biosynthesis protein LanM
MSEQTITLDPAITSASSWTRALFLHERRVPGGECALSAEARDAGEARGREWRRVSGVDDDTFARRLAAAGLTWEGFVRLLAAEEMGWEPMAADEGALDWTALLDEIRRGTHADVAVPRKRWNNPDGSVGTEPPFSGFIHPFLQIGVARLRAGRAAIEARHGGAPLMESGVEMELVLNLIERLVKQCSGTLILELNVARLRGQLQGDTPNERFRYFSERHFTPEGVLELLAEYPVLARLLAVTVERWAAVSLEFLGRLAADRGDLGELLGGSALGTLRTVHLGVSDLHRGGRSVVIAQDVHGRRVVYKPVPLAADACMRRLMEGVNGFGLRHPQRAVRVMERGEYGWIEYVRVEGCATEDELRRFYWRQGSLIALLQLVRGADFHHENLLACGEHPVLVDNEALFHHGRRIDTAAESAAEEAALVMGDSVMRQALLPFVMRLTPDARGIDSSGLGGAGGQRAEGAVRRWTNLATDEMRVVVADLVTEEAQNLPSLDGRPADATDFLPEIVQGFAETYDLVLERRDEVAPLLDAFADATVRHLIRHTRQYAVYLREGNHPNDLRDGLSRDELLDRLWAQASVHPRYLRAIAAEQEDLRTGDVPAFYTHPGSVDLWDGQGRAIEGFFLEPSLRAAHRLLGRMCAEDRDRQLLLIRLALSEARPAPAVRVMEPAPALPARALEEAAVRVGEELKRRAITTARGSTWISVDPFVDDSPGGARLRNVVLARADLYYGSAGIGLFLGYLGAATGRDDFTALARDASRGVLEAMARDGASGNGAVGAYLGRASYAYALLHLGTLWREPALLDAALADVARTEALIPQDRELDLLGGSAGCALVMLQLHQATGDRAALRAARACGEHLLRNARPAAGGLGWSGSTFGAPVAGLSHGAAGIAWALFALADATGDERFRVAAVQGVAFERTLLAGGDTPFHARASWCHGLPSVGLGRVLSTLYHDDTRARAEVRAGAERLLAAPLPGDLSLCHGVLGNAELLSAAAGYLRVPRWQEAAGAWAGACAAPREAGPYLPLHERFAGLMPGLAGVGWGLLRFARPGEIPSVLALDPPPPAS